MLQVKGYNIIMTRGDTARINLTILDADGNPYTPSEGDVIKFSVKKSWQDTEYAIQKTITDTIHIEPADTAGLDIGDYVYDVQIALENGDVNTIIPPSVLTIEPEVTV